MLGIISFLIPIEDWIFKYDLYQVTGHNGRYTILEPYVSIKPQHSEQNSMLVEINTHAFHATGLIRIL